MAIAGSRRRRWIALALFAACALVVAAVRSRRPAERRAGVAPALDEAPASVPVPAAAVPALSAGAPSLSGRVASRSGAAIAGARVCAVRATGESSAERPVCADAARDGRYRIASVAPGAYSITAEAAGYFPGTPAAGSLVTVAAGESKDGIDIVLDEGGAKLAGRVEDATGGVVAGATVRALRMAPPQHAVAVASDRSGQFALWVLPGPVTLVAEAPGYVPERVARVAPSADITLRLVPGSTVRGVVVAAGDGRPVADVAVHAVPVGGWASAVHPSGISSAEGAFEVDALAPGRYELVAEGAGWRGESKEPIEIGLADTVDRVTVTVSSAARVSGTVLVDRGPPCAQGSVSLGPTSPVQTSAYDPPSADVETTTSAVPSMMAGIEPDGRVRFRSVPPGAYHVVVQCGDHVLMNGPTTLAVGAADVDGIVWKVVPGLSLLVHVTDEAGHALPGARFLVEWPAKGAGAPRPIMPLAADLEGETETPHVLYAGTYTLRPESSNDGAPVDVVLREGTGRTEATLALSGSGSIVARVQTPQGDAVDDVTVVAVAVSTEGAPRIETSAVDPATGAAPTPPASRTVRGVALGGGRFRIGPLADGRYQVDVVDGVNPPSEPAEGAVQVARGAAVEVTVVLDRKGQLRGRVVDASGQPVPDVWVSASCRRPGSEAVANEATLVSSAFAWPKRVVSGPDGRFAIDALATGSVCQVRAERPNGAAGELADVRPGAEVSVTMPAQTARM